MYRNARKGIDNGVGCDGENQQSVNPRFFLRNRSTMLTNRVSPLLARPYFSIRYKARDSDISDITLSLKKSLLSASM